MKKKWCAGKGSCLKGGHTQFPVNRNYYKSELDQFNRQFGNCWKLPDDNGCWLLPNGDQWLIS